MTVEVTNNVVHIDRMNYQDIPGMLRRKAADIEGGKHGKVDTSLVVMVTDTGIEMFCFGETRSYYEVVGILQALQLQALNTGTE